MQPNLQNLELTRSAVTRDMSLQQPTNSISMDQTQSVLPPSLTQSLATTNARLSNIKQHLQEHLNAAERQTVNNKQPAPTNPVTGSETAPPVEQVEQIPNANIVSDDETAKQTIQSEQILQLVAHMPNHPLQKQAQRYFVDKPKSPMDLHSKSATGETTPNKNTSPTTPTSKLIIEYLIHTQCTMHIHHTHIPYVKIHSSYNHTPMHTPPIIFCILNMYNVQSINDLVSNISDTDLTDISRIFIDLVRSEHQMLNFAAQDKACATLSNINESKLAQIDNVCEPDSDQSKSNCKFYHYSMNYFCILLQYKYSYSRSIYLYLN